MKRYGITRLVLSAKQFIDLSQAEFESIREAKTNLVMALNVEEKLNLVLENYAELEREMLGIAADHLLFQNHNWSSFVGEVHLISRRIVNLLSACRMYIDQVKHEISSAYGPSSEASKELIAAFSHEYDSKFGYRVMESLRNYVQHRSLPVHSLVIESYAEDKGEGPGLAFCCVPKLHVDAIAKDETFKPAILQELKDGDEHRDLRPLVRTYIEGIGNVHEKLRERMSTDVKHWEEIFSDVQKRFGAKYDGTQIGLAAVAIGEDDRTSESVQIFDDILAHRRELEAKNRMLTKLHRRYVTNRAL